MNIKISPGIAHGTVSVPPSKSMAHRYIICAALAQGKSIISNVVLSEDINATLQAITALGAQAQIKENELIIKGTDILQQKYIPNVDCRESGSTLRFLIPICLLTSKRIKLFASEKLLLRPLDEYITLSKEKDFSFFVKKNNVILQGPLTSGVYEISLDKSSQFSSGLIFALPMLKNSSIIRFLNQRNSFSYVRMTIQALREFGVHTKWLNRNELYVPSATYNPRTITVEGDCSNAALFEALNRIGGNININNLACNTLQGDRVYKQYFDKLEKGFSELDIADCPDLAPILMVLGAVKHGVKLVNTKRLRFKESNRGEAMKQELQKFSVNVHITDNSITVEGTDIKRPLQAIDSHNDHRIAMATSVLLTITGGVIKNAQAINKSYPDFYDVLNKVNITTEII